MGKFLISISLSLRPQPSLPRRLSRIHIVGFKHLHIPTPVAGNYQISGATRRKMAFRSLLSALLLAALHYAPVDAHKRVLLEKVRTITLKKGQVCRSSPCALFPSLATGPIFI